MRVASQVAERLKTLKIWKHQENRRAVWRQPNV